MPLKNLQTMLMAKLKAITKNNQKSTNLKKEWRDQQEKNGTQSSEKKAQEKHFPDYVVIKMDCGMIKKNNTSFVFNIHFLAQAVPAPEPKESLVRAVYESSKRAK